MVQTVYLYNCEIYGVNDYLKDFYNKDMDAANIYERISDSAEERINFGFSFNKESIIELDAILNDLQFTLKKNI